MFKVYIFYISLIGILKKSLFFSIHFQSFLSFTLPPYHYIQTTNKQPRKIKMVQEELKDENPETQFYYQILMFASHARIHCFLSLNRLAKNTHTVEKEINLLL